MSGTPQAYLTILFFDERFNLIPAANSGVHQMQVRSTAAGNANATALPLTKILSPNNGYAYIYVSNRSDQDVFFDNLEVLTNAGYIAGENHYYPFGLKIAAISSHKLGDNKEGKLSNPYQYNDKELLDENTTLSWYDYGFRNYDPQVGRFPQLDPLTDGYPELTPFQFAGNDPIANVDVDGLEPAGVLAYAKAVGAGLDSIRPITSGMDAGGWVVTVTNEFGVYARIFKAAAPVFNKTLAIINFAVKGATIINKLETRPPTAGGLTASQQATIDRMYEEDNSYPDGTKGIFHLPTKAQTENYPIRSGFRAVGYYGLEFIGIKQIDVAIATWRDPKSSGSDKATATFAAILAGAHGEGEGEGSVGEGGESTQPEDVSNEPSSNSTSSSEKFQPEKTQWGWRGTKVWKNLVNRVREGGTIEELNGKIPTEDEAMKLIEDAGAKYERTDIPHAPPNPHNYDHINYYTPSGGKGTIKIQKP